MIIILKNGYSTEKAEELLKNLHKMGFSHHISMGAESTIVGVIGDTSKLDVDLLRANDIIADVRRITEPYKAANRKFHPEDTVIRVQDAIIGGGHFCVAAGPCSVESEEQIIEVAKRVKAAGAKLLRGGAFKPRTSPYAFQGLRDTGLKLLMQAKKETGLPIVTELMHTNHLEIFEDVDIIQVGARNMQNFEMLKALGKIRKPILLKRGLANTLEEWLMSAEYILAGGNEQVILCERGIRTFETATRNTLDLAAIPLLKRLSHLPVMVDPSHATGLPYLVKPLSKATVAVGGDGLMIEVHNHPKAALCDGAQSVTPDEFDDIMQTVQRQVAFEGRKI